MDLGICVIYQVNDSDGPLLDLHLSRIAGLTDVPYRIYGCADRLQPGFHARLEARSDVTICPCTEAQERGYLEHSHQTRQLADFALADGASHITLLHVDSFPIRKGWARELVAKLAPDLALAAVMTREVGEEHRPRSCCIFVPREFYASYGPVLPAAELRSAPRYREYLDQLGGMEDSEDTYGYVLYTHGLRWHRMLRSNAVNDHYFMGGVYDDLIFHLGAASRRRKVFRPHAVHGAGPRRRALSTRLGAALLPRSVRDRIPDSLRRMWNPGGVARVEQDRAAFDRIRANLLADPDGYIEYLRTGERR